MMKVKFGTALRCCLAALLLLGSSSPLAAAEVLGYVGPGAGLTMLGALFAVTCLFVLAVLAPILYPIRLLIAWRRRIIARQTVTTSRKAVSSS